MEATANERKKIEIGITEQDATCETCGQKAPLYVKVNGRLVDCCKKHAIHESGYDLQTFKALTDAMLKEHPFIVLDPQ